MRRRRHRGERGQTLPLLGLALALLTAFTGLSVDLGHQFAQKRIGQTAVDTAAVVAANQLGATTAGVVSTLPAWNSTTVSAAHDYVAANGFTTTWPSSGSQCLTGSGPGQFSEEFFDSAYSGSCATPSGYSTELIVNVPPRSYAGSTMPTACTSSGYPDNCVQVVLVQKVTNYIMQLFGFSSEYLTTYATGYSSPTVITPTLPSPIAVQLSQPTSAQAASNRCPGTVTCFNENIAAQRATLACNQTVPTVDNCPTLFAGGSSSKGKNIPETISGVDGSLIAGGAHYAAVASAGDIVTVAADLNLCDPYGFTCKNKASGDSSHFGFMLAPGSNLYCGKLVTAVPPSPTPPPNKCTTTGNSSPSFTQTADSIAANQVPWSAPSFTPSPVKQTSPDCGGLILNGDPITRLNVPPVFYSTGTPPTPISPKAGCYPPVSSSFTIMPGQYDYIVINAGQYEFGAGLYYINGNAPVNSNALSGLIEPNGIDHSTEQGGGNVGGDYDLCPSGSGVTTCTQTAGVWIGQGNSLWNYGPTVAPSAEVCFGTKGLGVTGGGGGSTIVTGSGVSFYFAGGPSGSRGFVSTSEVTSISLSAPAPGSLASVTGSPMLFDVENPNGYVHLDGQAGATSFQGIVYQASGGAAGGGGVDIDPGLGQANSSGATLVGQVIANRLALFGSDSGGGLNLAVDFSGSWGTGSPPQSGNPSGEETSLMTLPAGALTSGPGAGFQTLALQYNDETMMDAYDLSVTLDNGNVGYFSQGLWTAPPNSSTPPSAPLPPQTLYLPSDANPMFAYQSETSPSGSKYLGAYIPGLVWWDGHYPAGVYGGTTGPTLTYHTDSGKPDDIGFSVSNDFTWGPQTSIVLSALYQLNGNPRTDRFSADVSITFPSTVKSLIVHSVDGDGCGDFDNTQIVISNGNPSIGHNVAQLVQ